jgi:DNA-binding MarR family transcriptional regulator
MNEIKILKEYYKIELNGKKISKRNVHVIAYLAHICANYGYKYKSILNDSEMCDFLQISEAIMKRVFKLFEKNGLIEVERMRNNCFAPSKCIIYRIKLTKEFIEQYGIEKTEQKIITSTEEQTVEQQIEEIEQAIEQAEVTDNNSAQLIETVEGYTIYDRVTYIDDSTWSKTEKTIIFNELKLTTSIYMKPADVIEAKKDYLQFINFEFDTQEKRNIMYAVSKKIWALFTSDLDITQLLQAVDKLNYDVIRYILKVDDEAAQEDRFKKLIKDYNNKIRGYLFDIRNGFYDPIRGKDNRQKYINEIAGIKTK